MFCSRRRKQYANYIPCGIFSQPHLAKKFKKEERSILISLGTTNAAYEVLPHFIDKHTNQLQDFKKILIEPRFYNEFKERYPYLSFHKASYTQDMFNELDAAVVRPGVGTLSDILGKKTDLIVFSEKGNQEMQTNTLNLISSNLARKWNGESIMDLSKQQCEISTTISFDGAEAVSQLILKYVGGI